MQRTRREKALRAGLAAAIFDQVFYAVLGQKLIPIPVVGALIGWLASGLLPGPGDVFGALYCRQLAIEEGDERLAEAHKEIEPLSGERG